MLLGTHPNLWNIPDTFADLAGELIFSKLCHMKQNLRSVILFVILLIS